MTLYLTAYLAVFLYIANHPLLTALLGGALGRAN